MTTEEAMHRLEICPTTCCDCGTCGDHDDALVLAIAAMREQAERNKGCEACNNQDKKWWAIFGARYPYLRARTQCYPDGVIRAEICPMCGKPLKEAPNE